MSRRNQRGDDIVVEIALDERSIRYECFGDGGDQKRERISLGLRRL